MNKLLSIFLVTAALLPWASSCSREGPEPGPAPALATSRTPLVVASGSLLFAWGDEADQVGLEPPAPERAAWGPQAVALSPDGLIGVLDNRRERVALFDDAGRLVRSFPANRLASDFCFVSEDEIALLNLSALTVEKVDTAGKRLIVYPISPAFKTAVGLDCIAGRPVIVTMHQESYFVDSLNPLATRREGIPGEDGAYRQLAFAPGIPGRLLLYEAVEPLLSGAGEKPQVATGFDSDCAGVRLLGALDSGEAAFLCDIPDGKGTESSVTRFVDLYSGASRAARLSVESGGIYQPFRGFRISGSALVTAVPLAEGLKVTIHRFSREVTR